MPLPQFLSLASWENISSITHRIPHPQELVVETRRQASQPRCGPAQRSQTVWNPSSLPQTVHPGLPASFHPTLSSPPLSQFARCLAGPVNPINRKLDSVRPLVVPGRNAEVFFFLNLVPSAELWGQQRCEYKPSLRDLHFSSMWPAMPVKSTPPPLS